MGMPYRLEFGIAATTSHVILASRRVTRELDGIMASRTRPLASRCNNGPEFASWHFLAWTMERKIELVHIEPGRPVENAHVEGLHGNLRYECLNASWFGDLFEARGRLRRRRRSTTKSGPQQVGIFDAGRVCAANWISPAAYAGYRAARELKEKERTGEKVTSGVSGVVRFRARS